MLLSPYYPADGHLAKKRKHLDSGTCQNSSLAPITVILGKSLNLSEAHFPHLLSAGRSHVSDKSEEQVR